jgi:(2Fe-2S) ferredoxin
LPASKAMSQSQPRTGAMSRYDRHVFVCINERPKGHPKGCCLEKGSAEVRDAMKSLLHERGLKNRVRVNNAGCLDACAHGIAMVIYPEGIWYGGVKLADVPEIVDRTILNGEVIERLLILDPMYAPSRMQFSLLEKP